MVHNEVTSISNLSSLLTAFCPITGEGKPPAIALLIADENMSSYSASVRDVTGSFWNRCLINNNKYVCILLSISLR
jgi:hypothetical protein